MTRERIIELLDLVLACNEQLEENDITASLDVSAYHTDLNVYYHGDITPPDPGITMYSYTYTVSDSVVDGIKTVYDPELTKAEEHLRRIIDDVE